MKYSEAKHGRVFILRLEDGDILHEEIEQFAREKLIRSASLIALGGADAGSTVITGPEDGRSPIIVPMHHQLEEAHEVAGTGTIFSDSDGNPLLHMHLVCGRETSTVTGCVRPGVKTWKILEVIIYELLDCTATRQPDPSIGFALLEP